MLRVYCCFVMIAIRCIVRRCQVQISPRLKISVHYHNFSFKTWPHQVRFTELYKFLYFIQKVSPIATFYLSQFNNRILHKNTYYFWSDLPCLFSKTNVSQKMCFHQNSPLVNLTINKNFKIFREIHRCTGKQLSHDLLSFVAIYIFSPRVIANDSQALRRAVLQLFKWHEHDFSTNLWIVKH